MSTVTLHEGDNREHLRRLIAEGVRVHSVVCDPPYGLTSVTKRFGGDKAAPAKFGTDGAFQRVGAGFMGSKWDGTGIERDPEFWRLIYDILLPGGYVVAFSSPRTGHWQACAMEIAGFVMHPFLGWLYGSGMPKAHNAAMAIDKALGVKGTRGAPKSAAHAGWIERGQMRDGEGHEGWQRPWMDDAGKVDEAARVYQPASDEAKPWDGWAYGAQALKPALEPIYVGQKPFEGKTGPANFLKHGVGAINIAACRVEATGESRPRIGEPSAARDYGEGGVTDFTSQPGPRGGSPEGRHPANLLHDGSPEVVALFPTSSGQQGKLTGKEPSAATSAVYGEWQARALSAPRNDAGSAARFFNAFLATEDDQDDLIAAGFTAPLESEAAFYQGKATKADRAGSKHPTVKPIALMRWLCRLVTPAGGVVLDPFGGSGTTGAAAIAEGFEAILMEAEPRFAADIRARFGLARPVFHYSSEFDDVLGGVEPEIEDLLG